jgi:hypothetical protein
VIETERRQERDNYAALRAAAESVARHYFYSYAPSQSALRVDLIRLRELLGRLPA